MSGGYPIPSCRQPLFLNRAFGPYLPGSRKKLNFGEVHCPNCERLCAEQGAWLEQSLFLGSRKDMDDIVRAFAKVYEHRSLLNQVQS